MAKELTTDEQKAKDFSEGKKGLETAPAESGGAEVQAKIDTETEQGFRGVKTDPKPNESYSVAGVTSNV